MNWTALFSIDWSQFHFLRPQWLWLSIPLLVGFVLLWYGNFDPNKWKSKIASHLQSYMFSQGNPRALVYILGSYLLSGLLMLLAASGPTWKLKEIPGAISEAQLVIAMDLSRSMLTDDIQPNRLERAKLKIRDLLDHNPRVRTGLLAYAGTAHLVIPPTSDYTLVNHQAASLQPWIMPINGSDMVKMMNLADTLFDNITAPSTLLILTDEVQEEARSVLANFVDATPHQIELLIFNTSKGGNVPGIGNQREMKDARGAIVYSRLNQQSLDQLGENNKITVHQLTLDQSDAEVIAEKISKNIFYREDDELSQEEWEDMGAVLLLPLIILTLLWFRKGFVVQWCLLGFAFLCACSPDSGYADWWYTRDYQGQALYDQKDYLGAAKKFQSEQHQAVAYFKAGNYEAAANLFAMDSSAAGKYNLGLSLTELGRYDEAIASFEAAKKEDPNLPELDHTMEQVAQMSSQVDSVKRFNPETAKEEPPETDQGPLNERQAKSKDEQLTSDTEVDELPETGDRVTDEIETDVRKAEELDRPPEDRQFGQQQQAQKVLLKKVNADPAEFLRRRFEYQREKYHQDIKEGEVKW